MKPPLQALPGPGEEASVNALAAKALGHSHATCRSGLRRLALNYYAYQERIMMVSARALTIIMRSCAYRKRNSFSWKRRHSQSGSLENETIASIVWILESSLGFTAASPTVAKLGKGLPCCSTLELPRPYCRAPRVCTSSTRARVATKAPFLRR